jgi:fructose-bisphosphate aldolase class II
MEWQGHFNVADWVLLKAVLASGQELKVPVVVGASEGEREFFGVRQIAALVRSLREECDCPIFLNADHTHSLAKAVEAARAGFDAIVFDLSALPFEQNVRQTNSPIPGLRRQPAVRRSAQGQARAAVPLNPLRVVYGHPLTLHGSTPV